MPLTTYTAGEVLTASSLNANLAVAGGLQLVKSQTIGTAVASVTVSDAFSATYDNYKIIISGGSSTGAGIDLIMGATATGYYNVYIYSGYGTSTVAAFNGNNATLWAGIGSTLAGGHRVDLDMLNPFLAKNTSFSGANQNGTTNAGFVSGYLNNTTSYTGFTIQTSSGTLTGGTIRVYGYSNG